MSQYVPIYQNTCFAGFRGISTGGVLTDAPDKYPHPWRCPEGDAVQGEPETRTRSAAHNLLEWWFQAVETREEGEGDRKLQSPWGFFEDLCGMQLKIVPPGDGEGGLRHLYTGPCLSYLRAVPRNLNPVCIWITKSWSSADFHSFREISKSAKQRDPEKGTWCGMSAVCTELSITDELKLDGPEGCGIDVPEASTTRSIPHFFLSSFSNNRPL